MKYVCAALFAALLLMGWLYRGANNDLAATKASLAAAEAANESNRAAIARMERSMENTDKILAGWNEDRTTLAGVRSASVLKNSGNDHTTIIYGSLEYAAFIMGVRPK